jgi:hypothetical protein
MADSKEHRMAEWILDYLDTHFWAALSIFFCTLIIISVLAEKRRQNRKRIEDVGFMPWTGITVMSVFAAVISAAFAIKSL